MLLLEPLRLFSSSRQATHGHSLSKESNVPHLFPVQAEIVQGGLSLLELSNWKSDSRQLPPCSHSSVRSSTNPAIAYFMLSASALIWLGYEGEYQACHQWRTQKSKRCYHNPEGEY